MAVLRSQNGWSANDRAMIASYSIPGGRIALRKGDVSVILIWIAEQFHRTVEPLRWPGNWGYAERTVRGSTTTLSNHASGTAIDLNAPAHPLGRRGTFTPAQVRAIRAILAHCEGTVRWGGDYVSRPDEMHFEVVAGAAGTRRVADKIRAAATRPPAPALLPPPPPPPAPPWREEDSMQIPILLYADGMFRGTAMAEAPPSKVTSGAYIVCGSTWGWSEFTVTALRWDGLVLVQWQPDIADNHQWSEVLPEGTRMVTVEGKCEVAPSHPAVQSGERWSTLPAAAVWMLPIR